jgi:hypothetical protein
MTLAFLVLILMFDNVHSFFFTKDAFECEAETCCIPVRLLQLLMFVPLFS